MKAMAPRFTATGPAPYDDPDARLLSNVSVRGGSRLRADQARCAGFWTAERRRRDSHCRPFRRQLDLGLVLCHRDNLPSIDKVLNTTIVIRIVDRPGMTTPPERFRETSHGPRPH